MKLNFFFLNFRSHSSRESPNLGSPDIVYSFLRADGQHPFLYIQTSDPNTPLDIFPKSAGKVVYLPSKMKKRGEEGFKLFLHTLVNQKLLFENDVIFSDGERSFKTVDITARFEALGIKHITFPSNLHHLLNPCDNNYHSILQRRYYQNLSNSTSTKLCHSEKLMKALYAHNSISNDTIISLFRHCGLTSPLSAERIVYQLTNESIYEKEGLQNRKQQIECYNKWATEQKYTEF